WVFITHLTYSALPLVLLPLEPDAGFDRPAAFPAQEHRRRLVPRAVAQLPLIVLEYGRHLVRSGHDLSLADVRCIFGFVGGAFDVRMPFGGNERARVARLVAKQTPPRKADDGVGRAELVKVDHDILLIAGDVGALFGRAAARSRKVPNDVIGIELLREGGQEIDGEIADFLRRIV